MTNLLLHAVNSRTVPEAEKIFRSLPPFATGMGIGLDQEAEPWTG